MSIWSIALTLFLVANPIGNIPAILALVKGLPFKRQQMILLREGFLSLFVAVAFLYIGEQFLSTIQIKPYAVSLSGGVLLFIVSLNMVFPPRPPKDKEHIVQEPFLVPIATPLITGGGVLSTILIYSNQEQNNLKIVSAIAFSWVFVILILVLSTYLLKVLGQRGLLALEQLMGMILTMIAMQIMVNGLKLFIEAVSL